ncbi:MAG: hypothetical protein AB1779_01640, partial [Candidatus Thermoplasmatota archaeon]
MKKILAFWLLLLVTAGNFGQVFGGEDIESAQPLIKTEYSPIVARGNATIDDATLHWLGESINFDDVAWKPDGSYCIIVGHGGMVIKYDGLRFTVLARNLGFDIYDAEWKPNGEYA